jgi:hypothetical protein
MVEEGFVINNATMCLGLLDVNVPSKVLHQKDCQVSSNLVTIEFLQEKTVRISMCLLTRVLQHDAFPWI